VSAPSERLFTPRFFVMCGFTFSVFVSVFMLLPTTPFRILALGGTRTTAGMFLGLLTYSSALSAPVTGALGDRLGKRRVLIVSSLAIAGFSAAYGLSTSYRVPLTLVVFHGVFWSALLSASAAYLTDLLPEARRAEGIGYWGLSSLAALAVAPKAGFWLYDKSWGWLCGVCVGLNLLTALIAISLEEAQSRAWQGPQHRLAQGLVEWHVLATAFTLFLYTFAYGGINSFVALYSEWARIEPKTTYFTAFAVVTLVTRPFSGRWADRVGHRRIFLPCLVLMTFGLALLVPRPSYGSLVASAVIFGAGFGTAYPTFAAYVLKRVDPARRGAGFGSILAAFDTGIGTGSIALGWIIERHGYATGWAVTAVLSAAALPYFLFAERRFLSQLGPTAETVDSERRGSLSTSGP
jgi:MFS family permease